MNLVLPVKFVSDEVSDGRFNYQRLLKGQEPEFESSPLALLLLRQLEGDERSSIEGPEVVQLDLLGLDPDGEDESFRVESANRFALNVHDADASWTSQVPETNLKRELDKVHFLHFLA